MQDRFKLRISKREKQILQMLTFSVKEMALNLQLKPSTVATYIKRLYEKFNVNNRVALYIEASKHGLIDENNYRIN